MGVFGALFDKQTVGTVNSVSCDKYVYIQVIETIVSPRHSNQHLATGAVNYIGVFFLIGQHNPQIV